MREARFRQDTPTAVNTRNWANGLREDAPSPSSQKKPPRFSAAPISCDVYVDRRPPSSSRESSTCVQKSKKSRKKKNKDDGTTITLANGETYFFGSDKAPFSKAGERKAERDASSYDKVFNPHSNQLKC